MWAVPAPSFDVRTVLPDCVADETDSVLRAKYAAHSAVVYALSDTYRAALQNEMVHYLEPVKFEVPGITTDEMVRLYDRHLVGASSAVARAHYDKIRSSSELCYACNHEVVEEVDHYLPKRRFPALAVTPQNLTPICIRCNRAKGQKFGRTRGDTFIQPYADNFEAVVWLHAEVHTDPEPHLTFHATHATWDVATADRVSHHMRRFKLSYFYGIQANKTARQASLSLRVHLETGGYKRVRAEAETRAASARADRLNSWEAATWTAFAKSDWFCEGGFEQFGRKL